MKVAFLLAGGVWAASHQAAAQAPATGPEVRYAAVMAEARRGGINAAADGRAGDRFARAERAVDVLVDNPTLSVAPGYRVIPDSDRGFELQASLMQPIRTADVAGARRRTAASATRALTASADAKRFMHRQRAGDLWLQLWQARELRARVHEHRRLADAFVAQTARAVKAGLATREELALAQGFAAELVIESLTWAGRAHELGLSLSLHLGRRTPVALAAAGEPPRIDLPDMPALAGVGAVAVPAPAVRAARARSELARAELEKVDAERAPSVGVGLSLQREAPEGVIGYVNASFQLPFFDRSTLERAAAQADVVQAEAATDLADIEGAHRLVRFVHEVQHQREVEAVLRERLLPTLVARRAAAERLLSLGEGTVLSVLRARQAQLSGQRRLLTARADRLAAEQCLALYLEARTPASRSEGAARR